MSAVSSISLLPRGLTLSMSGTRLDADQDGLALRDRRVLHGRCELEAMGREDAIVMVARGDEALPG